MSLTQLMERADRVANRRYERSLRIARATGVEPIAQDRLLDALERQPQAKPVLSEVEGPEVIVDAEEEVAENWDGLS